LIDLESYLSEDRPVDAPKFIFDHFLIIIILMVLILGFFSYKKGEFKSLSQMSNKKRAQVIFGLPLLILPPFAMTSYTNTYRRLGILPLFVMIAGAILLAKGISTSNKSFGILFIFLILASFFAFFEVLVSGISF
jgi:hypothetical protein